MHIFDANQISFFFQSSTNLLSAATKLTNANVVSVRGCGIELAEQQELQNADNKISSKDESSTNTF